MAKKTSPKKMYQLKVTLRGSKPPIWRRIVLPDDIDLEELHYILQTLMGWNNSHLHQFLVVGKPISRVELSRLLREDLDVDPATVRGETYYSDPRFELENTQDESNTRLDKIAPAEKSKLAYWYDFGDDWWHDIVVEKIRDKVRGEPLLACTAGKLACPPDDSGGVWGYYDQLEAFADPEHENHRDVVEWLGKDFDPEHFDVDEINRRFKKVFGPEK